MNWAATLEAPESAAACVVATSIGEENILQLCEQCIGAPPPSRLRVRGNLFMTESDPTDTEFYGSSYINVSNTLGVHFWSFASGDRGFKASLIDHDRH